MEELISLMQRKSFTIERHITNIKPLSHPRTKILNFKVLEFGCHSNQINAWMNNSFARIERTELEDLSYQI